MDKVKTDQTFDEEIDEARSYVRDAIRSLAKVTVGDCDGGITPCEMANVRAAIRLLLEIQEALSGP